MEETSMDTCILHFHYFSQATSSCLNNSLPRVSQTSLCSKLSALNRRWLPTVGFAQLTRNPISFSWIELCHSRSSTLPFHKRGKNMMLYVSLSPLSGRLLVTDRGLLSCYCEMSNNYRDFKGRGGCLLLASARVID